MEKQKLSMTFLLGPTAETRTGGPACILEYARRFQERGHDVSITTWPKFLWPRAEPFPHLGFEVPIHYDKIAKPETLPFHLVKKSPRDWIGELQFFTAYMNLLTPAIPKADLVIAAGWDTILPGWQAGRGRLVHFPQHYDEVFFTLDGSTSLQANPLIKVLCRNSFQAPAYRIANSTWLAREFERRFGDTVPVVVHGIDCAKFRAWPKRSGQDGILRVVTYSRPEKWKGFQDAAAAMGEAMRRHGRKIEWHVYGFAHEIAPENPFAPYVFHGALDHDALSRLYAESDIVLCPSWYESFPLPPIEAMACGTAVITTPYGTEDYAIDGETALVARPRVLADFASALDALIAAPELRDRLARNGRAMAQSLTWDRAVRAREELLWRIHRNQAPVSGLRGFDTGIDDGYGRPFEQLIAEISAQDGDLFDAPGGRQYRVEFGRLRRVGTGSEAAPSRPLDVLALLRNLEGPEITAPANDYGLRA